MTTSVYVARFLGVDTGSLSSGALVGTIVGGDDALDTHDGDTSYVMLYRNGDLYVPVTEFSEMTFRWERLSGPAPTEATTTSVTIEGAMRRDDTATPATAFVANFVVPSIGAAVTWLNGSGVSDAYIDRTSSIGPFWTTSIEDGTVWRLSPGVPDPFFRGAFRLTYLRATIEHAGTPHLRQRNRGRLRQRNHAARQDGIRQRGFL